MIIKKSHVNFLLLQSDSQSVRDEKIASTVKLVRLFLDTMTRCLRDANERLMLTDTAYFLCKHGSYACL